MQSRLPGERLVGDIRQISSNSKSIKAAQQYGSDSLLTKRVFSSSQYDVQFVAPINRPRIRVVFTPDDLTFDGAPVYKIYVKVLSSSNVEVPFNYPLIDRQRPSGVNQIWDIYLQQYVPDETYRLKFYFAGISTGTFTATAL